MGVDTPYRQRALEKAKRLMNQGFPYHKFSPGENTIRVLPPPPPELEFYQDSDFWIQLYLVSDIRNQAFFCPKRMLGIRSYLAELAEYYRQKGMEKRDTKMVDRAKLFEAKERFYSAIYDSKDKENPFKVIGYSSKHNKKMMSWFVGTQYGDFTDLESGYDIVVIKTGDGKESRYEFTINDKLQRPIGIPANEIGWIDLRRIAYFVHPDDIKAWIKAKRIDANGEEVPYDKLFSEEYQPRVFSYADYCDHFFNGRIPSSTEVSKLAEKLVADKIDLWELLGRHESPAVKTDSEATAGEVAVEEPIEPPDEFDDGSMGVDDLPPDEKEPPEEKKAAPPKQTAAPATKLPASPPKRQPAPQKQAPADRPDPIIMERIMKDKQRLDDMFTDKDQCFGQFDQNEPVCVMQCPSKDECVYYRDKKVVPGPVSTSKELPKAASRSTKSPLEADMEAATGKK